MMTKARALANLLSQGNIFADSQVAASEVTGLHTVATTGSYADLVNKPTVVSHFTNDANYASTTYVNTQVSNLVASAPAALDTLNELASALGNDASFSATTATALGNRLRVDTAAQSLSSTQKTNAKTNLDLQNVENKSSATIRGELTSSNVTTALGFTPYNATNPNAYISGNQTITFSGDATGSGAVTVALTLANSGVTAGTYGSSTNIPQLVVDAKGRVTSVSNVAVSIPSGALTFTGDVTGSGSTGSSTALTLANSGVTAGTYTKVTVDAKGRVTTGATLASADLPTYTGSLTSAQVTGALGFTPYNSTNPSGYINGNQTITFSGDATGSGTTSVALTLANSGVTAGTYTRVTVDGKGRVTAASAPTDTAIFDVNVNTSTYWTITRPNGSALSGNIVYRITLVTLGTGTDTGEVYLVSNPDGAGWQLKAVTKTASGSNYPYVFLDSGIPKVKSDHASLYTTRVLVEEFNGGNSGTLPSAFGLDAFFTHDVNAAKYRSSWNGSDNILLHAGNYNSYSPTLTGGGASGTWGINIIGSVSASADQAIVNQNNGNASAWYGRILSKNSTNDRAAFLGTYASVAGVFAHNNALTAWAPLHINTTDVAQWGGAVLLGRLQLDADGTDTWYRAQSGNRHRFTTTGGADFIIGNGSGVATLNGNQVLHAANYTSYSPSLTGSGASGTWGISITGNAGTAGGLSVHAGVNNEANKIVRTDGSGYIYTGWINTTSGDNGTTAIDRIYASHDTWLRYYTPANFRTVLDVPTRGGTGASGTWGISITGSAATLGGKPAQDAVGANTIPTRDGSGYTYFNYINSNTGNSENPSVSQVIVTNGSDGFYRKASIAHLTSAVQSNASGTWGINVTAASGRVTYQGTRSAETGTTVSTPGSSMDVVGAYSNGYPESFGNVLSINGGGSSQLYMGWVGGSGAETGELYYRSMTDWRTNWGSWRRVLTNANYTSYSPSLTGSGASGTWGISITGNAATASRVTSGNLTPASTSFNNALIPASGSTRVLTFDGNGSLPSVWWSNGTRAYGAIDAIDPGLAFWANNGSSWQQQMTVNYGNVTINTDIRTPILYDSNDTGYYLNPNSSSRLSSTYTDNSYTYGWFRNYNQNGLYNETHGNHWYATGNNYWNLAGNNTTHVGIILRTSGHQGTVRGYVYADNNNSIGFLNSNGSWRFRVVGDDYSLADGSSMRAPLFYDSNDTTYYIDPASTSVLVSGYIFRNFLRRETTTHSGISWYSPSYTAWCNYMSPAGAGSSGPTGNITAPSGTYVNSWALRSFIENASGYGWTFESGTSSGQPSVVAEIRASDGLARFSGGTYSPNFYDSNDTGYYLDPNSTSRLNYVVPNRIKLVSQVNNEPRWDFSAYVVEAQHWYGNNGSQTMYLGESNWINIRNTADIHGDARSPIYYDRNDTGYYLDPNANTALRTVGSWRADSATWDGEFAGKIQYHSSNWYIQYSGNAIFRNSGGSNIMTCDSSGNVTFSGNVTAYSDRNKKTNITTLTTAQQYFDKIDAKNYVWKDTGKEDIGFVAQDVEAAGLHMFVHNNEVHDPNTGEVVETIKSLDYGRMVAVLWQTVKELKQELDALKSKQ